MTIQKNENDTASIEAYSLMEFVKDVTKLAQSGYKLDYETNEGIPQMFGSFMSLKMYPVNDLIPATELKKVIESVNTEGATPVVAAEQPKTTDGLQAAKVDGRKKKI